METKASVGPIFKGGELSERGSLALCDYTKLPSTKGFEARGRSLPFLSWSSQDKKIAPPHPFLFFPLKSLLLSLKTENIDLLAKVMQKGHEHSPGAK